jgi:type II secretory pathway component PulM
MNAIPRTVLLWLGAGLVLAGVFAAYLDPLVVVDLASRVWSCF